MTSLLSLPDDILLAIFSHFSLDRSHIGIYKPTLCALSLVSRRFYHLATPCLYRSIYINHSNQDGASYVYDLLLRCVNGNAKLGAKVQSLSLAWDYSLSSRNPQELLVWLPNLRNFSLMDCTNDNKFDYRLYVPPPAKACHYELGVQVSKPSKQDIPDLLVQCRVHDLKLAVKSLSNLKSMTPAPSDQARKAILQSFELDPATQISLKALENLLSYPASLLHLTLSLPGLVMEGNKYFLERYEFSHPLSPKAISYALSSTFETLESLHFAGGTLFSDHDGSRFSMISFKKLKVGKAPAELFFSAQTPYAHLDELLPRSLMSLTINFDASGHVPPSLSWLSSLASHKYSHTPFLAHVKIAEVNHEPIYCGTSMNELKGGHYKWDEANQEDKWVVDPDCPPWPEYWKPPSWLTEEFEREGVRLEMKVWEYTGKAMSGEEVP